jgi:MFS family permease
MRRLLLMTGAVVLVDTIFFSALTPLLPHYAHGVGLGKTGAGVLAAAYPAGTFIGAVPSGILAARVGVKQTVVAGVSAVAVCILLFGLANVAWQLDLARFVQGVASAFSWTGALAWLVMAAPSERRGSMIGVAFAAAAAGALFGPVVGAIASVAGIGLTFGVLAALSLALAIWASVTHAEVPRERQPPSALLRVLGDPDIWLAVWFTTLPALLFGTLAVLAPLRLAALGLGAVAIGGIFLFSAAIESAGMALLGRVTDRRGEVAPLVGGLVASAVVVGLLPWPDRRALLVPVVALSGVAFGALFTPGTTLLSRLADRRGLDHGYSFALLTLAWAPGQTLGSAGSGALASATSDALPYVGLAVACALTLAVLWRRRANLA